MESNLDILETKVLEAINLIKELRDENGNLSRRCQDLTTRLGELEDRNAQMNHELDEVRQQAGSVEVYEEKRKEIEGKVQGLLQQLEALG